MMVPKSLPVLFMYPTMIFPGADLPIRLFHPKQIEMFHSIDRFGRLVAISLSPRPILHDPFNIELSQIHAIGCIAAVVGTQPVEPNGLDVFLHGIGRAEFLRPVPGHPFPVWEVSPLPEEEEPDGEESEILRKTLLGELNQASWQGLIGPFPEGTLDRLPYMSTANFLSLTIRLLDLNAEAQGEILEAAGLSGRLLLLRERFRDLLLSRAQYGDRSEEDLDEEDRAKTH